MWTRIEEQEDRVSLRFSFASCTQCAGWPLPEAKPYSCKPLPDCGHVWILRTPLVVGVWVLGSPGPLEASKHKIYAYPYAIRYGTVRLPPLLARSTGPCLAPPNTKCTRMGRDHSAERVVHTRLCVRAVCNERKHCKRRFRSFAQRRPRERLPFGFLVVPLAPRCSPGGRELCGETACSDASGERFSSKGSRPAVAASKFSATL